MASIKPVGIKKDRLANYRKLNISLTKTCDSNNLKNRKACTQFRSSILKGSLKSLERKTSHCASMKQNAWQDIWCHGANTECRKIISREALWISYGTTNGDDITLIIAVSSGPT